MKKEGELASKEKVLGYKKQDNKELIHRRLTVTFELYLSYALMELGVDTEEAHALLSRLEKLNLENILWVSPRVYRNKYLLAHYKGKYFNTVQSNKDSVSHYIQKADSLMQVSEKFYQEKLKSDTQYLVEVSKSRLELEALKLKDHKRENAKNNIVRLSIILVLSLGLIFLSYLFRSEKKTKSKIMEINKTLKIRETELNYLVSELQINIRKTEAQIKKNILLVLAYEDQNVKVKKFVTDNIGPNNQSYSNQLLSHLNNKMATDVIEEVNFEFMDLHRKFYSKLSKMYPSLTANNLKLCSLLKMNMSSKELSLILRSSTDSIKVARSRLRKKLNIKSKTITLTTFLNSLD